MKAAEKAVLAQKVTFEVLLTPRKAASTKKAVKPAKAPE